jgi:tetratricopeptide (TPR) repeat protein
MTSKMHKYIACLLLMLAMAGSSFGKAVPGSLTGSELLAKGNEAYGKGKYLEASKAYEQVLALGYESAPIYYNLGNAYYKLDEIPEAILYYEKAYKLSPGDEDIQVNLQFANLKITDKIEAVPEFFVAKWWRGLVMGLSLHTWSVWAVVLFLLGFFALIIYLFARLPVAKRTAFYLGIFLLVAGLSALVLASAQQSYIEDTRHAIVFSGTVNVQSAPGDKQKTLFVIHEGTKVQIGQREQDWIRIVLPNGNVGWIEAAAVREI